MHSLNVNSYCDIIILGVTGQGKTTTPDKLLIANPARIVHESTSSVAKDEDKPVKSFQREKLLWKICTCGVFQAMNIPWNESQLE